MALSTIKDNATLRKERRRVARQIEKLSNNMVIDVRQSVLPSDRSFVKAPEGSMKRAFGLGLTAVKTALTIGRTFRYIKSMIFR